MKSIFAIIAAIFGTVSFADAQNLRCEIAAKHYCTADRGCSATSTPVFNRIDIGRGTYARCDANGCDEYDAVLSSSGKFTLIEVPGRDILAKMSRDGSMFLEVVTLATDVYVSFGSCSEEK